MPSKHLPWVRFPVGACLRVLLLLTIFDTYALFVLCSTHPQDFCIWLSNFGLRISSFWASTFVDALNYSTKEFCILSRLEVADVTASRVKYRPVKCAWVGTLSQLHFENLLHTVHFEARTREVRSECATYECNKCKIPGHLSVWNHVFVSVKNHNNHHTHYGNGVQPNFGKGLR